jgi:ankyrin repeat protein
MLSRTPLKILAFSLLVALLAAASALGETKRILFIAGPASHGWNQHEFPAGCEMLAQSLNESGLNLEASVSLGWPKDASLLESADAIVLYSDGNDLHVAKGKASELEALHANGTAFAVLHYALEPGDPDLNRFLEQSIGAYFQVDWSVNPVWTLESPEFGDHSITQGVSFDSIEDEWYYHLKFSPSQGPISHLLTSLPPESSLGDDGPRTGNPAVRDALKNRIPQSLAWAKEEAGAPRGFGFTGGHFHHNWNNPSIRKLVLNGIAWTAGFEIPSNGIESTITPIVKHDSIERAIAIGDIADVERHLAIDPELLNKPGRGSYTPLHQAILRKKGALADRLLEMGADPNVATKSKQTALHIAISRSDAGAAMAVIEKGSNLSLRDSNGWTPLHLAAAKNKIDLVRLLLDSGADIALLSDAGGTPLHEASVSGSAELIRLLLDRGVDPSVISKTGKTALDHAIEFKNEAAIDLLKRK